MPVRRLLVCALLAGAVLAALVWTPIATGLTRATECAAALVLVLAAVQLARPHRKARLAVFGLLGLVLLAFTLPVRGDVSPQEERERIVAAALAYQGVPYVWGGESPRGIDCSGLVRRAYQDAALSLAVAHLSPAHLQHAADLWLHDTTAREFEGGPPIRGRRVLTLPNLVGATPAAVQVGDLAVVANGLHVLLYLGDSRWIQADPSLHRVHPDDARTSGNVWLREPAVILRPAFLPDGV